MPNRELANTVVLGISICWSSLISGDRITCPSFIRIQENLCGGIDSMSGAGPVEICVNQITAANGIQAIDWPGLIEVRRRETGPARIFKEPRYIKEPSGAESVFTGRFGN